MANCNCGISPLRKPCPRKTFDCSRCLSKMKNTGNVWTVSTDTFFIAEGPGGPLFSIPAFTRNLEWDRVSANYPVPSGDVQCISGDRGYIDDGDSQVTWLATIGLEGRAQIYVMIYYLGGEWKLRFWFSHGADATVVAVADYVTTEKGCIVTNPAEFTLDSTSIDPDTVSFTSIPSTVHFYHTKIYD